MRARRSCLAGSASWVADLPLADELAAAANQIVPGIAVVRRGVEANDPEAPGQTMCRRLADMKAWIAAGGQPDALCARCAMNPRRRNQTCPRIPVNPANRSSIVATKTRISAAIRSSSWLGPRR